DQLRLSRPVARPGVLLEHGDQLRRYARRAARNSDVSRVQRGGATPECQAAAPRAVGELQRRHRDGAAAQPRRDGRLLPHQHQGSHRAVEQLYRRRRGGHAGGAWLLGHSRRAVLHQSVDTKTDGVDVVANYGYSLSSRTVLHLTGGYNGNWTEVTRVDTSAVLGGHSDQLFSRVDRARLEKGNPRSNVLVSADLTSGLIGFTARTQ